MKKTKKLFLSLFVLILMNAISMVADACSCTTYTFGANGFGSIETYEWYTGGNCCTPASGYGAVTSVWFQGATFASEVTYVSIAEIQNRCCA